jgi:hypothetical protein
MGGGGQFQSSIFSNEKHAPVSTKKKEVESDKLVFSFGEWLGAGK